MTTEETTKTEELKEARKNNHLARTGLRLTILLFIIGWAFSVERNTARTATAIEFVVGRLPVLETGVFKNTEDISSVREQSNKNSGRLDGVDKRLDDHQRIIEIITTPKRNPE